MYARVVTDSDGVEPVKSLDATADEADDKLCVCKLPQASKDAESDLRGDQELLLWCSERGSGRGVMGHMCGCAVR